MTQESCSYRKSPLSNFGRKITHSITLAASVMLIASRKHTLTICINLIKTIRPEINYGAI